MTGTREAGSASDPGATTEGEAAVTDPHPHQLSQVTAALRDLASPPMPDAIAQRLREVVRAESQRRAEGVAAAEEQTALAEASKRTDLGSFRQNPFIVKDPQQEVATAGHRAGRTRTDE